MEGDGTDDRGGLAGRLRYQALSSSAWNGTLLRRAADEVHAGGQFRWALEPIADLAHEQAPALRLLAAAHRLGLDGAAPAYARHLPTCGGDGNADAAWPAFRELCLSGVLDEGMRRPVQTNEPGRAAALLPAFGALQAATGRPLRLLEIGSSAGLLLRFDRYRYEIGGEPWGDPASPVFLQAEGDAPLLPVDVVDRRGCDVAPLDPVADRTLLLSWIWPDQLDRFHRVDAALAVAAEHAVEIDRSPASVWLDERLGGTCPGTTTVIFHSIVWQYLPLAEQEAVEVAVVSAGPRATADAPLVWLRFEPHATRPEVGVDLRARTWPGGDDRRLAICGYHGDPVRWGSGPRR